MLTIWLGLENLHTFSSSKKLINILLSYIQLFIGKEIILSSNISQAGIYDQVPLPIIRWAGGGTKQTGHKTHRQFNHSEAYWARKHSALWQERAGSIESMWKSLV